WHERWRQFHRAVLIEAPRVSERPSAALDTVPAGERLSAAPDTVPALLVRPPWEAAAALPHEGVREIVIDPGQAFGTGAHASTRLCLELLLELAAGQAARGALLDVGTGSGVLAIAAAGLSFAPVLALDHDSVSVDAARANAAVNGAAIEVARYDLRTQTLPWPAPSELDASMPSPAPVVLANLLRPLLLELAAKLPDAPTHLIAGGLLAGEVDEVVGAFTARFELHERRRRRSGEWAAVWLSPA
ncbi:MAG TPA: 50S ribosomal protein L11 methyltransferase, partial [Solirubrobacteraceae bacterium]|nr:50S ribosomal protein L11 methyltransferase [Solirubrobacteraceae bacterium]